MHNVECWKCSQRGAHLEEWPEKKKEDREGNDTSKSEGKEQQMLPSEVKKICYSP